MTHPIRNYCRTHGLLEGDFAHAIGYTPGYLSQVISGKNKCGARFAHKVFQRFGIPIADLILWQPPGSTSSANGSAAQGKALRKLRGNTPVRRARKRSSRRNGRGRN